MQNTTFQSNLITSSIACLPLWLEEEDKKQTDFIEEVKRRQRQRQREIDGEAAEEPGSNQPIPPRIPSRFA